MVYPWDKVQTYFFGPLHRITAFGYRLSPWQNWSKIDLYLPAAEEAQEP
jgi:hypothetical protein